MSSYDSRLPAQIRLDEMIKKYEYRAKEAETMAKRYKADEELKKQLDLMLSDLKELKKKVDNLNKGGKIGNNN